MICHRIIPGLALSFLAITPGARPADPPPAEVRLTVPELSARIDRLLADRWKEKGVSPAPPAGDAEFFRRLSLDLNGRIPSVLEVCDFLDDSRPDKRGRWIEEFIRGAEHRPLFVNHWAGYWHTLLFSRTTNLQARFVGQQLVPWLREQVKANSPYDRMVRELISGDQARAFSQANENKPENLAGSTARLFLGINLECAQCHDHKFADWTRRQFWETAAFFAPGNNGATIKLPNSDQVIPARFLDGGRPQWTGKDNPRAVLAAWLAGRDNPLFARAAVNRLWEYFFGTGLTDPVDAMNPDNPPSHPELLDELAGQFAAHDFDLEYLIRALVGTRAYQLSSRPSDPGQNDRRLFARMAVRGLSPEQLYDSLLAALGTTDETSASPSFFGSPPATRRAEFLARFADAAERQATRQTSVLQALYMMNGPLLEESLPSSKTLATVQANDRSPAARNVTELYLAVLSRRPAPDELERLRQYVEGGPTTDRKAALADVFWALLNSAEFASNH
jgi:hypothetical protein